MESNVELALAAKMLKLFPTTEDTFLAFPTAGAAFTSAELSIFERPGESAEDIRLRSHRKAQFARLMNQIPQDSLRWNPGDGVLWTEYKQVLENAEMASTALTKAERRKLVKAKDYLSDTVSTPEGETTVYSPALVAYYQYKEAAEEVERTYLDEKLTVELSEDPAVKATWESGRRQELEAARTRAAQDWAVLGHKADVEAAQATVVALGGKDPQLRRVALLNDYGLCSEMDLGSNDPVGVQSTFYSPSDVFSPASEWNVLHLTGDEVKSLLAEAPAELSDLATSKGGSIDAIKLEYTSVTVMRPWFDPSFLTMRSWRLPEGDPVSDGGSPRKGRIPTYIANLVVARKVTITRTVPAEQGGAVPPPDKPPVLKDLGYLSKALRTVDQEWAVRPGDGPMRKLNVPAKVHLATPSSAELRAAAPEVVQLRNEVVAAKLEGTTITRLPAIVAPRLLAGVAAESLAARPAGGIRVAAPPRVPPHVATPVGPPVVMPVWPQPGRPLPPAPPPGRPAPPPGVPGGESPTTTQTVEEVTLDGVVVLAYRVRRVPKSPNPDPKLDWSQEGTPADPFDTDEPTVPLDTDDEPAAPLDARPFPLPRGHSFGRAVRPRRHDGTASAEDRVSVLALQTRLRELGFQVVVDGTIGRRTERAIRDFQQSQGLPTTGQVGPPTWRKLWK